MPEISNPLSIGYMIAPTVAVHPVPILLRRPFESSRTRFAQTSEHAARTRVRSFRLHDGRAGYRCTDHRQRE